MSCTPAAAIHLFDDHGNDFLFRGVQLAKLTSRMPGYTPLALSIPCYEGEKAFYVWVVEKKLAYPYSGVCHAAVCHSTQRMPDRPLATRREFRCLSLNKLLEDLDKEYPNADIRQQLENQLKNNNTSTGLKP